MDIINQKGELPMEAPQYRHEVKHLIDRVQAAELQARLRVLMQPDENARADGTYFIRSLYFDNDADKALREKADGAPYREKFRIRFYNRDLSFIRLEKKVKDNRLTQKWAARLTEEECRALLSGNAEVLRADSQPLVQELYAKMKLQRLKPKTVVDYTRRTFVHPLGNTRVTFDYDIRTGRFDTDILDLTLPTFPCDSAEPAPVCILEVKYDAFLPGFLQDALQLPNIRQTSYSKYEISRRFG